MERWVTVPGFEGRYEVSDFGRVRSLQCKGRPRHHPRVLRDYEAGKGYRAVFLFDGEEYQQWYVHRLVLTAFAGLPPAGHQGAHLDGSRDNNRLDNLIWASVVVNHSHKVAHGTTNRGEASAAARLTERQVREARQAWRPGSRDASSHALARRYGVTQSHMHCILTGRRWGHVPGARRAIGEL